MASFIAYFTVFFIMVLKTKELLLGHEEAAHYMTETVADYSRPIDLVDLQFTFALPQIDPSKGRIRVQQVKWPLSNSKFGESGELRTKTPIEMIDCNILLKDNQEMYDQLSTDALKTGRYFSGKTFLCPNSTELVIQGQTDS